MRLESDPSASASSSSSDPAPSRSPRNWAELVGLACLIASLLLISTGVRTVKADGEARMSVDPQRVEAERQKGVAQAEPESKKASVTAKAGTDTDKKDASETRRKPQAAGDYQGPGVSAIEVEPGVIVLNTRGFNYGPSPAAIDPAAMRVEKGLKPGR